MQNNGFGNNPQIPIFKGKNYHFWGLKMSTLFRSQEAWDLVEQGFVDPGVANPEHVPDAALKEKRKKDAKALFIIQSALDDEIFPRIASDRKSVV